MSAKNAYNKILTIFLIIMGIILIGIVGYMIYEQISAKMINDKSEEFISEFDEEMNTTDSDIVTDEVDSTQSENTEEASSKSSKVASKRSSKTKKSTKKYYSYDICGYIRIPKTGIKYPIIAEYSRNALEKGICLEYGPGPNEPGNTVLAGHNYLNRLFFSKNKNLQKGDKIYKSGELILDDETKKVNADGKDIKLTATEYNILKFLLKNKGKVYSISEIYENVWNEDSIAAENIIAVHIRHIREKIEINPKEPKYLKVIWGIGYKIENIK